MTAPNQTAIVLNVMKALRPTVVGTARSNFDKLLSCKCARPQGRGRVLVAYPI
jgi:hypothetical protein